MTTQDIMRNAKNATKSLMLCDETKKNEILEAMAQSLLAHKEDILNANSMDLEKAVVSDIMKDRLKLNDQRLNDMAQGILEVDLTLQVMRLLYASKVEIHVF